MTHEAINMITLMFWSQHGMNDSLNWMLSHKKWDEMKTLVVYFWDKYYLFSLETRS